MDEQYKGLSFPNPNSAFDLLVQATRVPCSEKVHQPSYCAQKVAKLGRFYTVLDTFPIPTQPEKSFPSYWWSVLSSTMPQHSDYL